MPDDQDYIAALRVSVPRRLTGVGVLGALTVLLAIVALRGTGVETLLFGLCAAVSAALTLGIWQASGREVVMKADGLYDSNGTVIVTLDQISRVNNHPLSVRPSNGFSVKLNSPQPAHWAPGLWWRWGRTVGVGGLTSAKPGRDLANLLQQHHNESQEKPE